MINLSKQQIISMHGMFKIYLFAVERILIIIRKKDRR